MTGYLLYMIRMELAKLNIRLLSSCLHACTDVLSCTEWWAYYEVLDW